MKLEEFIEVIKIELPESGERITGNTKFRDLKDWDSLTGMSIIVLLEDTYNKPISNDNFKLFITIEDIFNYIKE